MSDILGETYVKMPWHTFYKLMETLRYIAAHTDGLSKSDYSSVMDDLKEIEDETWDVSQA